MQPVHTDLAPAAIGTYSQAVKCGQFVYLSGQIPLDPKTMELISPEVGEQIEQVMRNLSAVCEAAGGSLNSLVKLQVYLVDLKAFPLVNEVMARHFSTPFPARAAVQVVALPRGAQVEIDGIMYLSE
jgi:reactive intermediate/imine deaminase